jgi:hypothetical protein
MDHADAHFEIAAGSVPGRSHVIAGKPNQDAFAFSAGRAGAFAVVCDGCGSSAHSEVGATIGARVLLARILAEVERGARVDDEETWERVRREALQVLAQAARAMGGRVEEVVSDLFLFTVIAVAIAGGRAVIVGIGDGFFAMGGERVRIGPFPGNAPPYLGYGLLGDGPRFVIHRALEESAMGAVLIGTDGAADLDELEGRALPGAAHERIQPISHFWTEDRFFQNRDAIRRALALMNRDACRPSWAERRMQREAGLLDDDTTLLVIRRRH